MQSAELMADDVRDASASLDRTLGALAGLLIAKWASHDESEREAIAAFNEEAFSRPNGRLGTPRRSPSRPDQRRECARARLPRQEAFRLRKEQSAPAFLARERPGAAEFVAPRSRRTVKPSRPKTSEKPSFPPHAAKDGRFWIARWERGSACPTFSRTSHATTSHAPWRRPRATSPKRPIWWASRATRH